MFACRREVAGMGDGLQKSMRKLWGVKDMFVILIRVMVLWIYKYVKTFQRVHFKYVPIFVNMSIILPHKMQKKDYVPLFLFE